MQTLGDEYGISKEAIRITLKNSSLTASNSALEVAKEINTLSRYLNTIKLSTLEEVCTLLTNNGFSCQNPREAALAIVIASDFGENNNEFNIIKFGCGKTSEFVFSASKKIEKQLYNMRGKAIKEIKKCGGCNLSHLHSEVLKLSSDKQPSKKLLKAILAPCDSNDIRVTADDFYFHTSRNKIISRVLKASAVFDFACPEKLSDAINQSIQHRCKGATMLSAEQLTGMITESEIGSVKGDFIHFLKRKVETELYKGERDIAVELRANPGMELPEIESIVASSGLSKASVFQLCSISPLITKKGKRYYSV